MANKQLLMLVPLVMLLGLMPHVALAYGTDVHFNLTYVLCRFAGLPAKNALWIAAADQSMDDNKYTTAYSDPGDVAWQSLPFMDKVWPRNGKNFHAFSDAGSAETVSPRGIPVTIHYSDPGAAKQAIRKRMSDLLKRVQEIPINPSDEKTIITSEIAMGQFLHFEQDYFAHRQMTPDCTDEQKWLPYGTFWGHSKNGHHPDYVAERPELAMLMMQGTYKYICDYAAKIPGHLMAASLSKNNFSTLIVDLSAAYPRKTPDSLPDDIPNQISANQQLRAAIQSIGAEYSRAMRLPNYGYALTLPYDNPETPLKEVERKIQIILRQIE